MNQETEWKRIWDNRVNDGGETAEKLMDSPRDMFLYMKKLNGFDINGDGMTYEALYEQFEQTEKRFNKIHECKSVFEVGCGSGANLYLFARKKYYVGGIDYSCNLLDIAKKYLDKAYVRELICGEAADTDVSEKYDAGLSNSVFSYFTDFGYAEKVLKKMTEKCRYSIVLIDIHDLAHKEDFIAFRRSIDKNYDERYKNLPKLFYPKDFFEKFAENNGFKAEFYSSEVKGYWNNKFVYNVCLHNTAL